MPYPVFSHYPFTTQVMLNLFNQGLLDQVKAIDLETDYGYVGRIIYKNGASRYFKGSNLDFNGHGVAEILKDKNYTKYFLSAFGYAVPKGKIFVTDSFFQQPKRRIINAKAPFSDIADAVSYVEEELKYPCFVKPNDGSQGIGVYQCRNADEVREASAQLVKARHPVILIEEPIHYPEFRAVVYQDQLICCYGRRPMQVIGDGVRTFQELFNHKLQSLTEANRPHSFALDDARVQYKLKKLGMTYDTIVEQGMMVDVFDSANLSTGGEVVDFTDHIHDHWKALCIEVTQKFNLAVCGVDIFIDDITSPDSAYAIVELNATPTLSGFATVNERAKQIVYDLYRQIINHPDGGWSR
jgi:D-alanine-D-alanine ligase-like ATP-grasp enzyme